MLKINEYWNHFSKDILPPDAEPEQVRDMKQSFYAGASAVVYMLGTALINKTDRERLDHLQAVAEEISEYQRTKNQ